MNRHGTETCYVNHGCRRPECREAHRRARARRALLQHRGIRGKIPAHELMPHITRLLDGGWSINQIEQQVGTRHSIEQVLRGRPVLASTAKRILAVNGAPVSGLIPADLTMLRIRSLSALGWSQTQIRQMAGLAADGWIRTSKPYVYPQTAQAILDVYRSIGDQPGPSKRVKGIAASKGWPLPAGWDDPGTLAWPAGVDPWKPAQRLRGMGRPEVWDDLRWADVEHLRSYGVPDEDIAARFGITSSSLRTAEARRAQRNPAA